MGSIPVEGRFLVSLLRTELLSGSKWGTSGLDIFIKRTQTVGESGRGISS